MEISWVYIVLLFGAAFIRLCRAYDATTKICKKKNEKFEWGIYWRDRIDNWAAHIVFMVLGVFFLPALIDMANAAGVPFLKDIKDDAAMSKFATFLLGYGGYDGLGYIIDGITSVFNKGKKSEETE
jgi:hypothetical protein